MKKILIIGLTLIIATGMFVGCRESTQERIKRICGVDIPADAVLDYDYFNVDSHGDFVQYTVFSFEERPEQFLVDNTLESCLCSGHEKDLLWTSRVDAVYLPDWDKDHLFKKLEANKKLYPRIQAMAFYFININKLIIYASLY